MSNKKISGIRTDLWVTLVLILFQIMNPRFWLRKLTIQSKIISLNPILWSLFVTNIISRKLKVRVRSKNRPGICFCLSSSAQKGETIPKFTKNSKIWFLWLPINNFKNKTIYLTSKTNKRLFFLFLYDFWFFLLCDSCSASSYCSPLLNLLFYHRLGFNFFLKWQYRNRPIVCNVLLVKISRPSFKQLALVQDVGSWEEQR